MEYIESEKRLFLGIDCGTQSLRACCVDIAGTIVKGAMRDLRTYYRPQFWAEQNANDWWKALVETVREVCQDKEIASRIAAISICGTCSTIVPCDAEMNPQGKAILWMDNRATLEAKELNEALKSAGLPQSLSSEQLAPKLLWLSRHRPDYLTGKLVECVSWLVFRLTGNLCVSQSITDFTWGIQAVQWEKLGSLRNEVVEGLKAIQASEKTSTSVAGQLKSDVALELGIQNTQRSITVAVGGNDGLLSAIGAGLLARNLTAVEIGGTSYVLVSKTKKLTHITPLQYGGNHINPFEPDSQIVISSIETGGLFLSWLRDLLSMTKEEFDALSKKMACEMERGQYEPSLLLLDINLLGKKWKNSKSTGAVLANLTMSTTRRELFQAALENVAFEACKRMGWIFSVCRPQPSRLLLAGGFSHNPAFLMLRVSLANTCRNAMDVYAVDDKYIGCRGAAMCGACADGVFKNLLHASETMAARGRPVEGFVELGYKLRVAQRELNGGS